MLKIDLDTQPGGAHAQWRKKGGDSYLSIHRRDGSRILRIHAPYAAESDLKAAAQALNKFLRPDHDANATPTEPSQSNPSDHPRDSGQT